MNRVIDLQGVANFRDVGQTVNRFLGRKFVREGVLFRSARPDDASSADKALIKDDLGIRTIIDLRTNTELIKQAQKLARYHEHASSIPSAWFSPRPTLPHIDGITYREIKITGRAFEMHLLRQLSWWSFLKVILFFILGYRISAIRIMATEVMLPRGLLGLGIDTVDRSGLEIKRALSLYANGDSLPILVHCTQGLIIILVLMILGTPLHAIEHDYSLTNAALEAQKAHILNEVREIGLTDEWVATSPVMIRGLQKHLNLKYGGLEAYLDGIGFDAEMRTRLRELLMC
ncbi:hypothetical protein E4U43_003786 [Claviceps pusilla]|uniref:Tyrosine specific protein phosphatases domain-containing protein n=1 Tax=Claviceps pusilla TaxID=123648 RepID=A0A9P7T3U8_9HYPO|nr:hypothetical protein E4U43_003786 [Claviceps pusilla]